MNEFVWRVRIYYEDTDSGGVVYYANYLKFMERARSEWLRGLGFEQDELLSGQGIIFVVRRAALEFLKPGRFNQLLDIHSKISQRGKASLTFEHHIMNGRDVVCTGSVKLACVDAATLRPRPIPLPILAELASEV